MPIELDSHNSENPVNVQPGTNEAEALCFLYANSDYGFKPAEVREHTKIPDNSAYKALTRLYEKDLIGKTADGYYHALDDAHVAKYAESLRNGKSFNIGNTDTDYSPDMDQTTQGHPGDDRDTT
ncbi:hypothetical protein EXE48_10345 [Halorubrum sp. ASP1]|uniref:hypothetical protein n=1 Tax=Halorubrum sp. ASP1 TaxID=2518114 RepID=UPI0010F8D158|nr:hypothetical protein [Halorubrum sp. ASP1]TKX60822.1 hypothetical protein EXE48_10345 [Halorubrum sp. ASP1]